MPIDKFILFISEQESTGRINIDDISIVEIISGDQHDGFWVICPILNKYFILEMILLMNIVHYFVVEFLSILNKRQIRNIDVGDSLR